MKEILYIQKYIYLFNNNYVIKDIDLNILLNINVINIIKKHKKMFNKYAYKIKDNYYINEDGIVLISIINNNTYLIDIILDMFDLLDKLKSNTLNKISI